nr:MAG TPA: hypothetical protein [Caudoviricetes sp.]
MWSKPQRKRAKGSRKNIANSNIFQRVAIALSWSVTYTFSTLNYNLLFPHTYLLKNKKT